MIAEGIKAVSVLAKDGIRTNVTLCFRAAQALLAAKAGAYIVSPFVGRVDDIGYQAWTWSKNIMQILCQLWIQNAGIGGVVATFGSDSGCESGSAYCDTAI